MNVASKSSKKQSPSLLYLVMCVLHFPHQAQLQGKHAELCTATFDPTAGTLGPNTSMEITVNFISHTDVSTSY